MRLTLLALVVGRLAHHPFLSLFSLTLIESTVFANLVVPAGLSRQPEHPQAQQGAGIPGAQVQHPVLRGMGIPTGPKLPAVPMAPGAPAGKSTGSVEPESEEQ